MTGGRVRAKDRRTAVCFTAELRHSRFLGDPRAFEMLLRRFSALSREDASESLKVALVQKGITDDALKTHLVLHAWRLSNFQLVREEVRSVLITRQALCQGPVPIAIGALDAKDKDKDKDKDQSKDTARWAIARPTAGVGRQHRRRGRRRRKWLRWTSDRTRLSHQAPVRANPGVDHAQ